MATQQPNAEGSGSKRPRKLQLHLTTNVPRGKSSAKTPSTAVSGLKRIMSNPNPTPATPNVPFAVPLPASTANGEGSRKVKTVPPSAQFDPPTPPSPPHLPLPADTEPDAAATPLTPARKRPRPRLRYSTSSESGADSDSDDDEDEDPPWWTFTNKGMMKMRARSQRRAQNPHPDAPEVAQEDKATRKGKSRQGSQEDGEGKNRMRARFAPSRRSTFRTGSDHEPSRKSKSVRLDRQPSGDHDHPLELQDSPLRMPEGVANDISQPPRLLEAAPIRPFTDLHFLRRRSDQPDNQSDTEIPRRRVFNRSNSAPGSPSEAVQPLPPPLSAVLSPPSSSTAEPVAIAPLEAVASDPVGQSPSNSPRKPHRQMTAPSFSRFRRLRMDSGAPNSLGPRPSPEQGGSNDNLSDSEAHMFASPRWRAKRRLTGSALARSAPIGSTPGGPGGETSDEGYGTGGQPKSKRLNSHLLRLPPPMKQHFANGWPHAGSWQDALYGYYEDGEQDDVRQSRRKERRAKPGDTPTLDAERVREVSGETLVSRSPAPDVTASGERMAGAIPATPEAKKRNRKARRYRQALLPPTPKGLGFTPRDEEEGWKSGRINNSEFNWEAPSSSPAPNVPPYSTIMEGDELSRTATRMTAMEKGEAIKRNRKIKVGRTKRAGEDWRVRWKRMLFLDARLTILIRLLDMMVVTTLLGVIGPSTTLTIAFASFTIIHGMTAIYREYFGKPIGLWGLRSKMLWVCLDLLFVALWSGILSLATNDYITTPLQCTFADPWWLAGLPTAYSQLLIELGATGVTDPDLIKATLGVNLPDVILNSSLAREVCYRQRGCIALSLLALLLYAGNMVLSLFRIFETVRRTADIGKAVMV